MDLLTLQQLSDKLQLTHITVRKLVKNNTIPYIKVSGQYRFEFDKVVEALKENTAKEAEKSIAQGTE